MSETTSRAVISDEDKAPGHDRDKPARRKALVIGIDHYGTLRPLHGCVNDALAVQRVLACDGDDASTPNFDVTLLTAPGADAPLTRRAVKDAVRQLFSRAHEIALFYFAGHGHVEPTGGFLCSSECTRGDDGLALVEVLIMAINSPAREKIIILDSCHSGVAGTLLPGALAAIPDGLTILTASTEDQYAKEKNGSGVFTALLVDALSGAAANHTGDITPGSVYAHIDQSLGRGQQRPVFKTNVSRFVSLRQVTPPISRDDMLQLPTLFPRAGHVFALDPSFEPRDEGRTADMPRANKANTERFAILQRYNRVNLVVPVGAPHMWNAAMESKACRLTALGEHYRRLVSAGLL